jgi:hypothetical protein
MVDRVMWHYVRGLAFAARKQIDPATEEHNQMLALLKDQRIAQLDRPKFPATSILTIAEHLLAAKIVGSL